MTLVNWDAQPLGKVPDRDLAGRLGVSSAAVRGARNRRSIPPFQDDPPDTYPSSRMTSHPTPQVAQTDGGWLGLAIFGDTHYGSADCDRQLVAEFGDRAREWGISRAVHVGDILEGSAKHHHSWELEGHGFDQQAACAVRDHPRIPTLAITGNHDEWFEDMGHDVGRALMGAFADAGRSDLEVVGRRCATIAYHVGGDRPVIVNAWHPMGSSPAPSKVVAGRRVGNSRLHRHLASMAHDPPDVVVVGHRHQAGYFLWGERTHVFMCPAFKRPEGSFSNALSDPPVTGSWLMHIQAPRGSAPVRVVRDLVVKRYGIQGATVEVHA